MHEHKNTVLLVDDDHEDLDILVEVLKEINPSLVIEIATSCMEALQKLDALSMVPQLIFIDQNMRRMDGEKCLAEIRRRPRYRLVNIIMYSSSVSTRQMASFQKLGASFLEKQSEYKKMITQITAALQRVSLAP